MKYELTEDGQWIQPVRKGYRVRCCDCGLVHNLDFRIRNKRVQFRAFRNERSTGQIRRHMPNVKMVDTEKFNKPLKSEK